MSRDLTPDEIARLAALAELNIKWDTSGSQELDLLAKGAAESLGVPIGLISIILHDAQYWPGMHGLGDSWMAEGRGTPVEWSYCELVVETEQPVIIHDTTSGDIEGGDVSRIRERVENSPVTKLEGIQCYLGVPLRLSTGDIAGSVCVIGAAPRKWTAADVQVLQTLAERVVGLLEKNTDT